MKQFKLRDGTPEEQIKQLARTVKYFGPRLVKQVVAVLPPIPVGLYTHKPTEDGFLFGYTCALSGTVAKVFVSGLLTDKKPVMVKLAHKNRFGIDSYEQEIEKSSKPTVFEKDLSIEPGDILLFSTVDVERVTIIGAHFKIVGVRDEYEYEQKLINELILDDPEED